MFTEFQECGDSCTFFDSILLYEARFCKKKKDEMIHVYV